MFAQLFREFKEKHETLLREYAEAKEKFQVKEVILKEFESLPPGFVKEREKIFSRYTEGLSEKGRALNSLGPVAQVKEGSEAIEVFNVVESRSDFAAFLDLLYWLPQSAGHILYGELLTSREHVVKLRRLVEQTPVAGSTTRDMDEGCLLNGDFSMFSKFSLLLFQIPSVNEEGVLSLINVRAEKLRRELAEEELHKLLGE